MHTAHGPDCKLVSAVQLRSYPELDPKERMDLFQQHLDCAGAFGNPKGVPIVGGEASDSETDEEGKADSNSINAPLAESNADPFSLPAEQER